MLNTRKQVATSIARPLIELEALIHAALVKQAELQVAMVEGHKKAKLPLGAGEASLDRIAAVGAGLVAVRRDAHAAHLVLREEQERMGLGKYIASGDYEYGDTGDTPRGYGAAETAPTLAVVRAA